MGWQVAVIVARTAWASDTVFGASVNAPPSPDSVTSVTVRLPVLTSWNVTACATPIGSVPKSRLLEPTSWSVAPRPVPRSGIDAVRATVST